MAEREAAIKLTLDDGQFVAAMGKAGDAAVKSAQKSERAMQVFGAGVKKATSNLQAFGATARSSIGMVSGLLGGLSFGVAIKSAVELDSKYKQLAFNISRVSREQVKAIDVQKLVEQAAIKTGRRTAEVANTFGDLFQATGDAEFSKDMLESIGLAATATGADVGELTKLADQLHTKFGVAAKDMLDLFAAAHGNEQGGNSISEFAATVDTLGAEMLNAGLTGKRGIDFMIGALAATEDPLGGIGKQVKGIKQVLLSLGDTNQIKGLAKALHIDPKKLLNEKDLIGRLKRVLSMGPKGIAALRASMSEAEEQKALKYMFLDPFENALKRAQDAGLKGKAATDKALADLEQHIDDFGKSASTGADLVREANERRKGPEQRLNEALDQLQRTFSDPKIIEAIEDLSKHLPDIAKVFGSFAKFVLKNPILAGTLAVGGKAGAGFVQGAVSEALGAAFKEAFGGGGGGSSGGGRGGSAGGGGRRGSSVERHHQFLGEGLTEAQMLSNGIEDGIEKGGKRGASKLATAIRLAGIASAAALALELGKEFIDNLFKDKGEATGNLSAVGAGASSMKGPVSKHKADAAKLRVALAKAREERGGFFEGLFSMLSNLPNSGGFGMMSPDGSIMPPTAPAGFKPEAGPNLDEINGKQIAEMEALLKAKEDLIAKLEKPTGAAAVDGKAVADAIKAGAPLRVEVVNQPPTPAAPGKAGPGGSRGVKPPAAQAPGGGY
jgi:hypothetical protein